MTNDRSRPLCDARPDHTLGSEVDLDHQPRHVRFVPIVLKNSILGSVWVINQAADSEREEKHLAGRWLSGWDWD